MWGDRARSSLQGRRFGDVRWTAETGSTNSDLLELARGGAADGVVLVADHQRAGRGRMDRRWEAPAGSSLLVSILFRPDLEPDHLHLLTTALALAARHACQAVASVGVDLKWPNDLVVEGTGKVAGILAESVVTGDRVDAVVVGIGLNVNWPAEVPDEVAGIAVALNHLAGHEVDREDLLIAMLASLDGLCADLGTAGGRAALMTRYRDACATIGRRVRVELAHDERFVGRATQIDDDGRLVVETDVAGTSGQRLVAVGDVVHLRHT